QRSEDVLLPNKHADRSEVYIHQRRKEKNPVTASFQNSGFAPETRKMLICVCGLGTKTCGKPPPMPPGPAAALLRITPSVFFSAPCNTNWPEFPGNNPAAWR